MNEEKSSESNRFTKVKDSRGREVEGFRSRNGRFYYQLWVPSKGYSQYVPLYDDSHQPIRNLREAQEAVVMLKKELNEGENPQARRAPFFDDYRKTYIIYLREAEAKSDLTVKKEESALKGWAYFLGHVRVSQILASQVHEYVVERKQAGKSSRTCNLDVIALSNCLKHAKDEGWIRAKLPTDSFKALKYTAPKRVLRTREEVDAMVAEALRTDGVDGNGMQKPVHITGEQLADWLRLMQWSGARHTAALSCKWDQVDWDNKQVTFHTKYDKTVVVDFNEHLEAHLKLMKAKRIEGCDFLFPSLRSGGVNNHCTRMYKSLLNVKTEVAKKFPGMADFTPHDLRHFFISWCCEMGIDYLVIQSWVGHADSKLISTVYGHISNTHRESAVRKLSTPDPVSVLPKPQVGMTKAELLKALLALEEGQQAA